VQSDCAVFTTAVGRYRLTCAGSLQVLGSAKLAMLLSAAWLACPLALHGPALQLYRLWILRCSCLCCCCQPLGRYVCIAGAGAMMPTKLHWLLFLLVLQHGSFALRQHMRLQPPLHSLAATSLQGTAAAGNTSLQVVLRLLSAPKVGGHAAYACRVRVHMSMPCWCSFKLCFLRCRTCSQRTPHATRLLRPRCHACSWWPSQH